MIVAIQQPARPLMPAIDRLIEVMQAMAAEFVPLVFGLERPSVIERDSELVQRSSGGDHDAYSQLVERHQPAIARMMWRFSRDQAVHEELVQDVFVEAYLSLSTYSSKAPLANWLARIATRVGYRHWTAAARRKSVRHLTADEWNLLIRDTPGTEDPLAAGELLHRLLAELPPRDRLILTLRYLENCSIEQAAERAGWSSTMAKVQCWRAMKKLTALFEKYRKETGI
jgi:RNA polymerase sigma-70 factor, ECF subfamily